MTAALFNHLWQSTLFAVAVGLLSLLVCRNRARLRHGLWLAASVKFLVRSRRWRLPEAWSNGSSRPRRSGRWWRRRVFVTSTRRFPRCGWTRRRRPQHRDSGNGSRRCCSASGSVESRRSRSGA
jgi:hypothetical protein